MSLLKNEERLTGYSFDSDNVETDLVIILSIINSSQTVNSILIPIFKENKIFGAHLVQSYLIEQKLISTAIMLRMIDDKFNSNSKITELHYSTVGKLITKNKTSDLIFREACNKIIHADKFRIESLENKTKKYPF